MHGQQVHWDRLHGDPRFRPVYPSEPVVRFLKASRTANIHGARFLDIGAGAGRHLKLAADLSLIPFGVDISEIGLQHANDFLLRAKVKFHLTKASMLALPFSDASFEIVLSYGVFYYATAAEMQRAIREAHRVLAPKGRAFVVLRTLDDCRFGKGERVEPHTFRLTVSETNELGTVQHFLGAGDIPAYFSQFSSVSFEKTETTFGNRKFLDSDWLITAEK